MAHCQLCHRRLRNPPILHVGMELGPICAVRLGYVPPAREIAGKVAKRTRARVSRVADEATPDLFAELADYKSGPYLIAA